MAVSRGYSEMVELFGGVARSEPEAAQEPPSPDFAPIMQPLLQAFQRHDEAAVIAQLERHPELIHMQNPQDGMTLLHGASAFLLQNLAEWLLKRGASVKAVTKSGNTPLDVAGCGRGWDPPTPPERLMPMTEVLIAHGAERTPRWAVATGNADWLRARHAQGLLEDRRYGPEGLISLAVRWDQREILKLLLEFGFDPDDRHRLDLEPAQDSWGEPLKFCVRWGRLEMARILLDHGADPNGRIYAGGTPLFEAYDRKDAAMIELLESRNGYLDADLVGYLGLTDKARQMLADEAAGTLHPLAIPEWGEGRSVADLLIANGIGNLEMLKLVLPRIERSREDPWWEGRLREAWGCADLDCLRLLLEHCDVRACAPATLHEVAGNWPRSQRFDSADRCAKAALLLDFGAPLHARDPWQNSTPLGWACRFGRLEMVKLYLARGADPVEADAEPWAKPLAWAERNRHAEVVALLQAMS